MWIAWKIMNTTRNEKITLLIATQYLNEGGVGRQIQYLVNHLDHTHFDVHLVVFCAKDLFFTKLLDNEKVRVHMLNQGRRIGIRTWLAMIKLCRELRPDILHLFGGKANHLGGLASFFLHVPVLIFSVRSANNRTMNHILYRLLKPCQTLTIVNSRGIKRELVDRAGYHDDEVLIIHNFLDIEKFRPFSASERVKARQHIGFSPGTCLVACVGRLARQKNQIATLKALKQLKDAGKLPENFRFLFVGRAYDALYAPEVRGMYQTLALQDVSSFLEPVEDVVSLYNTLDGIFQPSNYEGLSNVVIEAQACGTPVALSRQADNDDLVRDGETGISFSIKSEVQIAQALERLIELCVDEERRRQMTERARSEVEKRFSLQRDISTLQETYFRLLQEQRGR
jgi:glycosyltransferase involved in cell wall biosynthesis